MTRLDGDHWTEAFPLPNSSGQIEHAINAVWDGDGNLWAAWPAERPAFQGDFPPLRQQVYAAQLPRNAISNCSTHNRRAAAAPELSTEARRSRRAGDLRAIRATRHPFGASRITSLRANLPSPHRAARQRQERRGRDGCGWSRLMQCAELGCIDLLAERAVIVA